MKYSHNLRHQLSGGIGTIGTEFLPQLKLSILS